MIAVATPFVRADAAAWNSASFSGWVERGAQRPLPETAVGRNAMSAAKQQVKEIAIPLERLTQVLGRDVSSLRPRAFEPSALVGEDASEIPDHLRDEGI